MNALTFEKFADCVNNAGPLLKAEDDIQIDGGVLRKAKFTAGKFRRAFCWSEGARNACRANNEVRSALVNAVMRECNVTNFWQLPRNVLEAFKGRFAAFADSDLMLQPDRDNPNVLRATNGRPLSVRRIRAIVAAVNASKGTGTGAVRTDRPDEPERVQVGPQTDNDEGILFRAGCTLKKFRSIFNSVNVPKSLQDKVWKACIRRIKCKVETEPDRVKQEGDGLLEAIVRTTLEWEQRALRDKNGPNLDWNKEINRFGGIFAEGSMYRGIGISLMEKFHTWFVKFVGSINVPGWSDLIKAEAEHGFRFFMFRELALRKSVEDNPDKMFGGAALTVLASKGLLGSTSAPLVLLVMPPEKRRLVCAAAAVLPGPILDGTSRQIMFSRIVRHLDEVEELVENKSLTAKSLFETLFSNCEENIPEEPTAKDFEDRLSSLQTNVVAKYPFGLTTAESNRTLKALYLLQSGRDLGEIESDMDDETNESDIYPVGMQLGLEKLDEDVNPGEALLAKDIYRPERINGTGKQAYTFQFPDETTIVSEHIEGGETPQTKALAKRVAEKVVKLCGSDNLAQISVVEAQMTQAGFAGEIGKRLNAMGYGTNEHVALTFELTKNDETGDVTIDYSEPEGCTVKISASVTVHPDGRVEKSELTVEEES